MEYPYFKGLEADRYNFYRVPKALVKADRFQKMSGDAKLLYAVLLDRMSLSIKNGWQDKHGNAYIICTIEEVMDSIHCARQKAVKLLDELEQEFRLIERRRQGLGKPNLLYVKDLYAGLSQSNYWKYENHTSGGMKNELQGVPKSNGSNTEKINKTDNSETDLIYPAELQEEEQYRCYFKEALELEILEQGYPADKAVLYEILELLVETVTSRKKFLRICGEEKPREVVKSRLMKLDSSHIQYILECLKENSTQIRNIFKQKLNGMSSQRIASHLNELGVLPPNEYKRANGFNYTCGFQAGLNQKWTVVSVNRILKNESYTGTLIQGKRRKINYKVKKSHDVGSENWIRVEDAHDAIISKGEFQQVQQLLELDTRTAPSQTTVYASLEKPLSSKAKKSFERFFQLWKKKKCKLRILIGCWT